MEELRDLLQLNDEQLRILDEIAQKFEEFKAAGGLLIVDADSEDTTAVNVKNVDYVISWHADCGKHEDLGYSNADAFCQTTPVHFPIYNSDFNLLAKIKHGKNLF